MKKIALFRQLFRGRTDIYPVRWESNKGGAGYSPACKNEWRPGVCGKPRIQCSACKKRQFLPVTDRVIYNHLAGVHTIGIYPLLKNDTCYFLATDFDKSSWREDVLAYLQSCQELNIPAADARRLGAAIISYTSSRTHQLSLDSYDRFFPNQDTLPKGGFGNLIALPLQKLPREKGFSVFVDDNFKPYEDQWTFLATLKRLSADNLKEASSRATAGPNARPHLTCRLSIAIWA